MAQEKGLNAALGWTADQTQQIVDMINDSNLEDYEKDRMLGYIRQAGDTNYQGYDYMNLDQNEAFTNGYASFDRDMTELNRICRNVFDDPNYNVSAELRK